MDKAFVPGKRDPGPDCTDKAAWGTPSALDQYIAKVKVESQDDYPADACAPYYYSRATIDNFNITQDLDVGANVEIIGNINLVSNITATVTITANAFAGAAWAALVGSVASKKSFDMPHPTKKGYRLRHICLEGPEAGVYHRGRVTNTTEILLPEYWEGLVDARSITINLTPIGSHQNVIVKRFDAKKIYLQSMGNMPIDCFYHIFAERKDGEKLIVEYQGKSSNDYPGDNSQYTVNR
jgi:hypothetical protein